MDDLISRQAILKHIEKIRYGMQMMDDTHRASIVMTGMHLCEEAVRNQPSAQPEQTDNAEFWRKRAEEYCKICFDLYMSMLEGTKFDSVRITEDGIVLMQKGGKND